MYGVPWDRGHVPIASRSEVRRPGLAAEPRCRFTEPIWSAGAVVWSEGCRQGAGGAALTRRGAGRDGERAPLQRADERVLLDRVLQPGVARAEQRVGVLVVERPVRPV